jgi:hypothetical protein
MNLLEPVIVIKARKQDIAIVQVWLITLAFQMKNRQWLTSGQLEVLRLFFSSFFFQNLVGECLNAYKQQSGRDCKVVVDENDFLGSET